MKKNDGGEHAHAKITCVCPFAPPFDTKKHMAASGASDGSIQIWSLETGALIKRHEKVLAGRGAGRVLVLRRREGTPRGRRARAVREVRRRGDGDRGERPFGGDASVHDSLREQEREAAQSYNRIGGFSSAILYRWAAVSVGTTRASEATRRRTLTKSI